MQAAPEGTNGDMRDMAPRSPQENPLSLVRAGGRPTHVNGGAARVNGGAAHVNGGAAPVNGGAAHINGGAAHINGGAAHINGGNTRVNGGADHLSPYSNRFLPMHPLMAANMPAEHSIAVGMAINGTIYQGVLFAQNPRSNGHQ